MEKWKQYARAKRAQHQRYTAALKEASAFFEAACDPANKEDAAELFEAASAWTLEASSILCENVVAPLSPTPRVVEEIDAMLHRMVQELF